MLGDETFHDRIEEAIAEAEERTSAEMVVAIADASGPYRDTDLLAGALLAGVALAVILFAPFAVSPWLVLPWTIVAFVVGTAASARTPAVRRLLTTEHRRAEQVATRARLAFQEEGVSATEERNGLLLYVSLLENGLKILPDLGIDGKVARAEWNRIRQEVLAAPDEERSDAIVRAIVDCGRVLETPFPPGEENPDEIPNRPRIRAR